MCVSTLRHQLRDLCADVAWPAYDLQKMIAIRKKARALMMWAGMLRFRMSSETYSQLTRLDVFVSRPDGCCSDQVLRRCERLTSYIFWHVMDGCTDPLVIARLRSHPPLSPV